VVEVVSERGQPIYDWWSRHGRLFELWYDLIFLGSESMLRERSMGALSLDPGDRVLELGCGSGNSFSALRERVGPEGQVIGIDYSAGMVARARDRVREAKWENVAAIRGDAGRPGVRDEAFDAVYTSMSLTAMEGYEAAIGAARSVLRPGGRLSVLDARPFQRWPWTVCNQVVVPVATYATNWVADADVPGAMGKRFESVRLAAFNGGTMIVATARKSTEES
jgi:phosphatidylethanolamine/phosphatidyl-N-methylethanolamine N-methyltransferase